MGRKVGRQQLLDQAVALFRARGYAGTSIDEIVKACGITKGSLYYHFGSKEELALAAMDQVHNHFREQIFSLVTGSEAPGLSQLQAFNRAVEEFFVSHPDGCLLANLSLESANPLFAPRIQRFFADWRACYGTVFARCYPPAEAALLAEDAVAAVHGCILMQRIDGTTEPLRRQHCRLEALLESRPGYPAPLPCPDILS